MSTARRQRAWRMAAMGVWLAGSMVSCAALFDLDGYQGAVTSLCDLLTQCFGSSAYPNCTEHVAAGLQGASSEVRSSWLEGFSSTDCLRNCTAAKSCLDMSPICNNPGASCSQNEHCCGFTIGEGSCLEGSCCLPDGLPCSAGGECCSDCSADTGTCGGIRPCLGQGSNCQQDEDCCSVHCSQAGRCAGKCRAPGEQCGEPGDCCSSQCQGGLCGCLADGATCAYPEQCCGGVCAPDPTDPARTICVTDQDCGKPSDGCGDSLPCCEGLVCGPLLYCCTPNGGGCQLPDSCCGGGCGPNGCCAELGMACGGTSDCCSGSCEGGTCTCLLEGQSCNHDEDCCALSCQGTCAGDSCNPFDCHSVCEAGGPLQGLSNGSICTKANGACAAEICQSDPVCCCYEWDLTCVSEAESASQVPGSACYNSCVITPI